MRAHGDFVAETLLAYLAALIALPLGLMSRGHERSRGLGNVAIVLTLIAIAAATTTLIWIDL